jgi:hypothetical protein
VRHLTIAIVALATSCGAQAANAASCEGWWWDKVACLEKRVTALEQDKAALRAELAELPKNFGAQIAALEARLGKRVDAENKDVTGLIAKSLKHGVKIRNGKLDTCLFSDNLGVGGFRKCANDDKEVWTLQ